MNQIKIMVAFIILLLLYIFFFNFYATVSGGINKPHVEVSEIRDSNPSKRGYVDS